jgi:cytochrome b
MAQAQGQRTGGRVWDAVVRYGHWLLAVSIALAWYTKNGGGVWHEWIGYASLVLVVLRMVWGWIGSRYARFRQFVCSPAATVRYAKQVLRGAEPRYLGHNPLGGWMVLVLLLAIALTGFTGWLYTTNTYWGEVWLENLHEGCAIFVLVLVALHVCGVVFTSLHHRENLIAAMIHGRKRPPVGDDMA